MNRAIYIFVLSPLARVLCVFMQYILRKASAIPSWRIHFPQASPFSVWELWVCTKRHCKIGLPQPNVTWHAAFSEPAIPCPWQEWWKDSYETCASQPSLSFHIFLSTGALCFSAERLCGWMPLSGVLQKGMCALLLLLSAAHSCAGQTRAERSVSCSSFAPESCHRDLHGPRQGPQGRCCMR